MTKFFGSFLTTYLLSLVCLITASHASSYPGAEWPTDSLDSVQIDSQKLQPWVDYAFTETKTRKTDALLIIRHGKLVYEKYKYGFTANSPHISWSMAKSMAAVVFGIAESEKIIRRDTKMIDIYHYLSTDQEEQAKRDQVTMYHLLTMSSGMQWEESYSKTNPLVSDVTQMLYMEPERNMGAYVASRTMKNAPGAAFLYSTGNSMLVMDALRHRMSEDAYHAYPWKKLFNKIGMKNVTWERDGAGTFAGGSYVYATARDYARFGYLMLNEGKWENEQVVPSEWMKTMRVLSPGLSTGTVKPDGSEPYGAGFWLNVPIPHWNLPAPYPAAPQDTWMAIGHNGQTIMMIPSKDLVIVRLAHDDDNGIDHNDYLKLLLAAVDTKVPAAKAVKTIAHAEGVTQVSNDPTLKWNSDLPVPGRKLTSFVNFTTLIARVRAKDFCSCYFVQGQTVDFCKELVLNGYPLIHMKIDESARSVTFGILPARSAHYVSQQFGCAY
jgi:CubicO group peptidase (beta-lactamase class C family)